MTLGSKEIIIDASNFVRGISSGADINDGGFSNETDAVNLTYNPGVLYAPAAGVNSDTDARLSGNIIASCPDMNTTSPTNRLLVTDSGKYYTYNGTKIPAVALQTDNVNTYAKGFTDMIIFAGEAYVTTKEYLVRWQNPSTFNNSFYAFTTNNAPHPAIVYENNAYYGDKNLLKQQTSAGGTPTTILTLSVDQVIMALGIDPGTGLMLISTTTVFDPNTQYTAINKLLWYNGSDPKLVKSVITDDVILGFHSIGGTVLVGYGQNIGYINGSGIGWLRKLVNISLDSTQLPYKHNMSHIGKTFYFLDGTQIIAYGEVLRGQKVFYPAFKNNINSNKFTFLGDGGSGKLVFGFATAKFYSFDTTDISTSNSMTFYTNKYTFPRPVYIRGFYFEYADAVVSDDNNRTLYYKTQAQGTGFVIIKDPTDSFSALKNTASTSVYEMTPQVDITADEVKFIQFRYITSSGNTGLRRIIIYWDPAE